MPTLTAQTHRCCICRERKPQHQFSVVTAICLECFDRSYAFCEECGRTLLRHGGAIRRSQYGQAAHYNGQTVCDCCRYNLGDSNSANHWCPQAFDVAIATYNRIGSRRKYGVEIETARCNNYRRLNNHTKFGAKTDCTVRGMEFDSPILYGDEGLTYIEDFLAFGEDNDWSADFDCGCHTHYDMRDESFEQLCSTAYAYRRTQPLWKKFVPHRRHDGSYSHQAEWTCAEWVRAVDRRDDFWQVISNLSCDRYEMVNLTAWRDHKTFEVRSLEGTCNPQIICDWITVNCRFIDAVRDMSFGDIDGFFGTRIHQQFDALSELLDDEDLERWLHDRFEG